MDPYLEDPALWRDVHWRLITYAADALQPQLHPRYHVRIEERLYVAATARDIYPDVVLLERTAARKAEPRAAALQYDAPTMTVALPSDEVSEGFLEIIDLARGGEVITVIEFLSPSNKLAGSESNRLYRQKQREVLSSHINLVEIDLLRQGEHTVAVPLDLLAQRGLVSWHYLMSIHRAGERGKFIVYTRTIRERLPRIPIPLAEDDQDAVLDVQRVLDQCYVNGYYAELIDYRAEPAVPLSQDDTAWVDALLREKGLRG
jgi:DUF971 family protein